MKIFFFHPSAFRLHPFRDPFAHERGLAETGGRRNEDDARGALQACVQTIDQARAVNDPWPGRRNVQLGGENGSRHGDIIEQPS